MGIKERKHLVTNSSDFDLRQDVLVSMRHEIGKLQIKIDYVPDRRLIVRESIHHWIKTYDKWQGSHEWLVLNILDDINNEVVPRWVRVVLWISDSESLMVEDRQPRWRTSPMIATLKSF